MAKNSVNIGNANISIDTVKNVKVICQVLSNPMKLKILRAINSKGEKGMYVQDIQKAVKLEQSHTSIHLGKLRSTNLVFTSRNGKFVVYRINQQTIDRLQVIMDLWQLGAPQSK